MWAAYKKGAFAFLGEDLDEIEFATAIIAFLAKFYQNRGEVFMASAMTAKGERPVGAFFVEYVGGGPLVRLEAEPHVQWFPWASTRNRVEATVKFLVDLKKTLPFRFHVTEADAPFFFHVGKYAVLRCVGKVHHYFGPDRGAFLFQSVGK